MKNDAAAMLYEMGRSENMHPSEVKEGKIEFIADCDGMLKIQSEKLFCPEFLRANDDGHQEESQLYQKGRGFCRHQNYPPFHRAGEDGGSKEDCAGGGHFTASSL